MTPTDQPWFEMHDVRKRRLDPASWIPLHAHEHLSSEGRYGHLGYRKDLFALASTALPVSARTAAEELGWSDVQRMNGHRPDADGDRYVPSDVDQFRGGLQGVALALVQLGNRETGPEWHLHQDLVIALGLRRERDVWVAIDEGYVDVARLVRDADGEPARLEVRATHLKDYLCARGLGLYTTVYRERQAVLEADPGFSWPEGRASETMPAMRWEGSVWPIHEGGLEYGEKVAIFHLRRTDVDPDEDVPTPGPPTDGNVAGTSTAQGSDARKLFAVLSRFWKDEWVSPATQSPRVRRDELPPTTSYVTDASGARTPAAELARGGMRWLWFRPEVIPALADHRGGRLVWATRDTGGVGASPDDLVHFGVNALGLVNAYAKDVARLPEWQQQIWAGHNVAPDGKVSAELLAAQAEGEPADTRAPEAFLGRAIADLNRATRQRFGFDVIRPHAEYDAILARTHRFRSTSREGLFALAKDVARLTADSIDAAALQTVVPPPKNTKWGSLKSLEHVLAKDCGAAQARQITGPLVGAYELRLADAHLPSEEVSEAFGLLSIGPNAPPIIQGHTLLHNCVTALYEAIGVLTRGATTVAGAPESSPIPPGRNANPEDAGHWGAGPSPPSGTREGGDGDVTAEV